MFYRYAGNAKKGKKRVVIDKCTFNKGHNISHLSRDGCRNGIMLFTDTSTGEAGMSGLKNAWRHTQRRLDSSNDAQILFYIGINRLINETMISVNNCWDMYDENLLNSSAFPESGLSAALEFRMRYSYDVEHRSVRWNLISPNEKPGFVSPSMAQSLHTQLLEADHGDRLSVDLGGVIRERIQSTIDRHELTDILCKPGMGAINSCK